MTQDEFLLLLEILSPVLSIAVGIYIVHVKITNIHQCFTFYFQKITKKIEVINNTTIEQHDEVEDKLNIISESIKDAMGHIKRVQDQIESDIESKNNRLNNFHAGLADLHEGLAAVLRKDAEIKDAHQNSQTDDTKE